MAIDLAVLGPAAVPDEVLASMVADSWGATAATLLTVEAEEFPYDVPAMTTEGRFVVSGAAMVDGAERAFAFFVKHIREWSRSPEFAYVPAELREWARTTVPWRTEAEVYSSDLAERLPAGFTMPDVLRVQTIDDLSYAVWLDLVDADPVEWDVERYRQAARLLGRFAASRGVRAVAARVSHEFRMSTYADGRLRNGVLPILHSDVWDHPLLAADFADLREPMRAAADDLDAIAAELSTLPPLAAHGDACPNNLLVRPDGSGFTLIDFGYFRTLPVGFDIGQLLIGDVQIGKRSADDLELRAGVIVEAYAAGLAEEGEPVAVDVIERAHALQLALFSGLPALPVELLDREPDAALQALVAARARIARYSLRLLDETMSHG
ncbi:phosphotransferase [Gordonia alkaliphila]|uniref:Aminoglycoside phosphotransferase domain-containing protein n=1 Tax=Gordonia alkaliphila TaxID=1053547 RepID=A0ABP8ZJ19_9ACTN